MPLTPRSCSSAATSIVSRWASSSPSFRHHADVVSATRSMCAAVGGCLHRSTANRLAAIPNRTWTSWSSTTRSTTDAEATASVASSSSANRVSNSDVQADRRRHRAVVGARLGVVRRWTLRVDHGSPRRKREVGRVQPVDAASPARVPPRVKQTFRPVSRQRRRQTRRLLNPSSRRDLGQTNPRPRRSIRDNTLARRAGFADRTGRYASADGAESQPRTARIARETTTKAYAVPPCGTIAHPSRARYPGPFPSDL